MNCTMPTDPHFGKYYQKHLKCTKLNGLRPKTIDAYARAIRRIGNYFVCPPAQDHHLCHSDAPALTNSLGGGDNYSDTGGYQDLSLKKLHNGRFIRPLCCQKMLTLKYLVNVRSEIFLAPQS
jgi:hypothetical protein